MYSLWQIKKKKKKDWEPETGSRTGTILFSCGVWFKLEIMVKKRDNIKLSKDKNWPEN